MSRLHARCALCIRLFAELAQQLTPFASVPIEDAKPHALPWRAARDFESSLLQPFAPCFRISDASSNVYKLLLWADCYEVFRLFSPRKAPEPLKISHSKLTIR